MYSSSYLIVVIWQPMPCCSGRGLHYAEIQAVGSAEIENSVTHHKLIQHFLLQILKTSVL